MYEAALKFMRRNRKEGGHFLKQHNWLHLKIQHDFITFCSKYGMKPSDVLTQVFLMVNGIHKRDFPFVKFHCGPACISPECPGYQDYYKPRHPAAQGNRRHIYDVMPGRLGDKMASLDCVNHSFEDELREWVPPSSTS